MGSGIAQATAQAGFYTLLYELNEAILEKARVTIGSNLASLEQKGRIGKGEKEKIFERIRFISDIQECLADFFIEAIIEKAEAKVALFNQIAELNHSECIFASNTSSLSVTSIASKIKNPERVIGMHFFNPAPLMRLVEVIKTEYNSQALIDVVFGLATQMGKTPVVCKDAPGFIVNRVARPYYIESLRLVEEGVTNYNEIDKLLEATGLQLKSGGYELIISYTGYQTKLVQINHTDSRIPDIEMIKEDKSLGEVVIKSSNEVKDGWEKYGSFFLEHFIGTTPNAANCRLMNPE
ncbi:putative 3-hydroxybutyryl-CoA dehydrogenase, partial [Ostertagia ostertagi]